MKAMFSHGKNVQRILSRIIVLVKAIHDWLSCQIEAI